MTQTSDLRPFTGSAARRLRVIWNPSSGSKGGIPTNRVDRLRLETTLSRLGLDNPNLVFVPTSEPFGRIEATVTRGA